VPGDPGVTSILTNDGDNFDEIDLGGASFNFYGNTYTSLFVSTKGLITFGSGNFTWTNGDLTSNPDQAAIAVLWDDLATYFDGNDQVLYQFQDTNSDSTPDQLVIEWNEIYPYFGSPDSATFQAVLQLNTGATPGEILMNYVDTDFGDIYYNDGARATVGIKDANPAPPDPDELLVSQDTAGGNGYVGSGQALTLYVTNNVNGTAYNDNLTGTVVNDLMNGGNGNDALNGGGGNDTLIGGTHNDTLIGGVGDDVLTGGSRMDRFVFNSLVGIDSVTDFNGTEGDVIAFSKATYTQAGTATNPVTISNAAATTATSGPSLIIIDTLANITALGTTRPNTCFAFDRTNNNLLYDDNGNWGDGAITIANVQFGGTFTAANFAGNDFLFVA
jgi:Ca2+-binding RTX toxin-like protein